MIITDDSILQIQNRPELRDEFIQQNKDFILKTASHICSKKITQQDDEWDIALIAFNSAISSYLPEKGNFKSFSAVIIKSRLIDYFRKNSNEKIIYVEPFVFDGDLSDNNDDVINADEYQVIKKMSDKSEDGNAKEEIGILSDVLKGYDIEFFDLVKVSPKAGKTKVVCGKIVNYILSDKVILAELKSKKTLPAKKISETLNVPLKILDKHRKYIIAAVEILSGEYPILSAYLQPIRKEIHI